MKKHLAVGSKVFIQAIISGTKTIETRFSKHRIPPFGQVEVGDLVYLKPSGGDIAGQFKVKKVIYFENIDQKDWEVIYQNYLAKASSGDPTIDQDYWKKHQDSRFGTLIFIGNVEQFITSPIKIQKSDQRGWVVLG